CTQGDAPILIQELGGGLSFKSSSRIRGSRETAEAPWIWLTISPRRSITTVYGVPLKPNELPIVSLGSSATGYGALNRRTKARVSAAVSWTWTATTSTSRDRYLSKSRPRAGASLTQVLQYEAWNRSTRIFLPIRSRESSVVLPSMRRTLNPGAAGAASPPVARPRRRARTTKREVTRLSLRERVPRAQGG